MITGNVGVSVGNVENGNECSLLVGVHIGAAITKVSVAFPHKAGNMSTT